MSSFKEVPPSPKLHVLVSDSCPAISIRPKAPSCAMKVDVHLPSGDGWPISELKSTAQQHFQRRLKLTAKGQQLDLTATLSEAGLRDGEALCAVLQLGKLAATHGAFAWPVLLLPFSNLGML